MKNLLFIIMIILLAGCAGLAKPQIVGAGPRFIIIKDDFGLADTHAYAEQHCRAQGLHAQFNQYVNQPSAFCYKGQCQYYGCVQ